MNKVSSSLDQAIIYPKLRDFFVSTFEDHFISLRTLIRASTAVIRFLPVADLKIPLTVPVFHIFCFSFFRTLSCRQPCGLFYLFSNTCCLVPDNAIAM